MKEDIPEEDDVFKTPNPPHDSRYQKRRMCRVESLNKTWKWDFEKPDEASEKCDE